MLKIITFATFPINFNLPTDTAIWRRKVSFSRGKRWTWRVFAKSWWRLFKCFKPKSTNFNKLLVRSKASNLYLQFPMNLQFERVFCNRFLSLQTVLVWNPRCKVKGRIMIVIIFFKSCYNSSKQKGKSRFTNSKAKKFRDRW